MKRLLLLWMLLTIPLFAQVERNSGKAGDYPVTSGAPTDTYVMAFDSATGYWVFVANGAGGGIADAPSDGTTYFRKDATWVNEVDSVNFAGGGVVKWNGNFYTIEIPTGLGPTMQVGQEQWVLLYNNSGGNFGNAKAIRPVGGFPVGNDVLPTFELAQSDTYDGAEGTLLITTMDIPDGTAGFGTRFGRLSDVNTSAFGQGDGLYLSSTIAGDLTNVRPEFPAYDISLGGVLEVDADSGVIFVSFTRDIFNTFNNTYNGTFREDFSLKITSNGTVITGTLTPRGTNLNMTMIFSDGFSTFVTDPAGATVTLTAGTSTNPQSNYLYVPIGTKLLTNSTAGFPFESEEHIRVAIVEVQTALNVQEWGALRNQNWNEGLQEGGGQGHLSHVTEKLRLFEAQWADGVAPTTTVTGAGPSDIFFRNTSGHVYQLHRQTFPALDIEDAGTAMRVVNDFTTPYDTTSNLSTLLATSGGVSMSGTRFSFIVWGVNNSATEPNYLMLNLPSGTYGSDAAAIADALSYDDYSIPSKFAGVGFLIARITLSHSASGGGTWTLVQQEDLRGKVPNTTAGGGGGGGGAGATEFTALTDVPNSYVGEALKIPMIGAGETGLEFTDVVTLDSIDVRSVKIDTLYGASPITVMDTIRALAYTDLAGNPIVGGTADPIDAETPTMLHFNGSANDVGVSSVTWTNATATFPTIGQKFGSAMATFAEGDWIYTSNTPTLGGSDNADFTIDFWVRNASAVYGTFYSSCDETNTYKGLLIDHNGTTDIGITFSDNASEERFAGSTSNLNDGNWHHLAFVRAGTNCYIYQDGVRLSSNTITKVVTSSGKAIRFGRRYTTTNPTVANYIGDIDEFRFSTVARWTGATYEVPTAEYGSGATFVELADTPGSYTGQAGKVLAVNSAEDSLEFVTSNLSAYWDSVQTAQAIVDSISSLAYTLPVSSSSSTLLHYNGNTTDDGGAPATWTNGGVSFPTTGQKFGNSSGEYSLGDWVYANATAVLNGSNNADFTIDFWVKDVSLSSGTFYSTVNDANLYAGLILHFTATTINIDFSDNSSSNSFNGSATDLNNGAWHHIAYVRSGTNSYIYKDGVRISSDTITKIVSSSGQIVRIGRRYTGVNPTIERFVGSMDEFRFSDSALWTEATYIMPEFEDGSEPAYKFRQLADTPNEYLGQAGKVPAVNGGETGLEFITAPTTTTYLTTPTSVDNYEIGVEHLTPKYYEGLPVYRKIIDMGSLLNNSTKSVAHGITGYETMVHMEGIMIDPSSNSVPVPFPHGTAEDAEVNFHLDATNANVQTWGDKTGNTCLITVEYTKIADTPVTVPGYNGTFSGAGTAVDAYELGVEVNTTKYYEGKPVYRKLIDTGLLPVTSTKSVAHGISNIEQVVLIFGSADLITGGALTLPRAHPTAGNDVDVYVDNTNVSLATGIDHSSFVNDSYVGVEYTKTTDSAIGTPYSYSTDEIVTGDTWIDGKTIYRKVISFGTLPNATTKNVAHGITGLTRVVEFSGSAINGTTDQVALPHVSNTATWDIQLNVNATNVSIVTANNYAPYTGYVILKYIK